MPCRVHCIATVLLMFSFLGACNRPPADSGVTAADSQKLPFDRPTREGGVSPSRSLIPSATKLPEGTPIPVRMETALSSATARAGDTFNATVDEAVVIDGQVLVAAGAPARGRVLEAKPSSGSPGHSPEPGYLRIVLESVNAGGKPVAIETSSIFVKGGLREGRAPVTGPENVVFALDRRLNFRLAQSADVR
jgi:hypothetical protein